MSRSVVTIQTTETGPLEVFDSTRTYIISDDYPFLVFQIADDSPTTRSKQKQTQEKRRVFVRGAEGTECTTSFSAVWAADSKAWKAPLNEAWSSNRVFGLMVVEVEDCSEPIQLYVLSERVVTLGHLKHMVQDIADELLRAAAWRPIVSKGLYTRVWVEDERRFNTPLRLADLNSELQSARAIRRRPPSEVDWIATAVAPPGVVRLAPGPECAVVSHWARRRLGQLNDEEAILSKELQSIENQSSLPRNSTRMKELESDASRFAQRRKDLIASRSNVAPFLRLQDLASPVDISPTSLRDPHIRRLMSAFSAPVNDGFLAVEARLSTLPPALPTKVFELWGAVWLARQLRTLGYQVTLRSVGGLEVIGAVHWTATYEDTEINLYYEPDPPSLRGGGAEPYDLPAVHDRDESSETWLLKHHQLDLDSRGLPPLYGKHNTCSPDYVLTVKNGQFYTLLIGDATLSDFKHANEKKGDSKTSTQLKMSKVDEYLRTVRWLRPGDEIVIADPLGGFLLLPGNAAAWDSVPRDHTNCDVTLIVPPISAPDGAVDLKAAGSRFAKLLSRHVKLPSSPGALP